MAALACAVATDMGRRRTNNEDRYYVDPNLNVFAVIDGVGGHNAGEHAADTAVEVMRERLERQTGTPEERLREAIALANNEIYLQARTNTDWSGMACVLTAALIEDDVVTVGHVGDSRLYLLRPGEIHKMTHDHSPVGEREDRGELSEAEAMAHPRRNEIYRDVGSGERAPDDPSFIEIVSFPMPADGAILLCSDGLTDLVSSGEIRAGIERYAPHYDTALAALVDAANHAGGKDNITAVVVASPEYRPQAAAPLTRPSRLRSRVRSATAAFRKRDWTNWIYLAGGVAAGILLGALAMLLLSRIGTTGPQILTVGPAGINATLSGAHSGDTVLIPQGKYRERIQLREGVTVRAQQTAGVTLLSPDGGPVVVAHKIENGSLEGVWIQGDLQSPADAGIRITDASPTIRNVRISGTQTGIEVRGASSPLLSSNQISNNLGAGIAINGGARPRIENNLIAANGNGKPGPAKPGIEVHEKARPVLKDNGIVDNAAEPVWIHGRGWQPADYEENFYGHTPLKTAVRLIDEVAPVAVSR